jgi:hypothetical protein
MQKFARKYALGDPKQELDDKEFWEKQARDYKIEVLEVLREIWGKMNTEGQSNGDLKGFRRVLRITKRP